MCDLHKGSHQNLERVIEMVWGPHDGGPLRNQNLLLSLSAGWCFLKQSLQ